VERGRAPRAPGVTRQTAPCRRRARAAPLSRGGRLRTAASAPCPMRRWPARSEPATRTVCRGPCRHRRAPSHPSRLALRRSPAAMQGRSRQRLPAVAKKYPHGRAGRGTQRKSSFLVRAKQPNGTAKAPHGFPASRACVNNNRPGQLLYGFNAGTNSRVLTQAAFFSSKSLTVTTAPTRKGSVVQEAGASLPKSLTRSTPDASSCSSPPSTA